MENKQLFHVFVVSGVIELFQRKKTVEQKSKATRPTPQPVWTDDDPSVDSES